MPPAEIDTPPHEDAPTAYKSFRIRIVSNLFFVGASAAYLAAAVLDFKENEKPAADQGASLSWILLIIGASGFIVVGILDYWNTGLRIHMILILAGIFGTMSAATSDSDLAISLICNLLAAHLFLLESLQWLAGHLRIMIGLEKGDSRKKSLLAAEFGDFCFFLGAFVDVIDSYYYLAEHQGTLIESQTLTTAVTSIISAVFWMIASLFVIAISCHLGKQGFAGVSSPKTVGDDYDTSKLVGGSTA